MREEFAKFETQFTSLCPQCKPACFSYEYDVRVTSSKLLMEKLNFGQKFPKNIKSIGHAYDKRNKKRRENGCKQCGKRKIHRQRPPNKVILNIAFDSMMPTKIIEQSSFTLIDFFLYSANIFNLFLGMSFLSIFETILEIILHI